MWYISCVGSWSLALLQFLLPVGIVRAHLPGVPIIPYVDSVIKKGHSPLNFFLHSCAHSASDVALYSTGPNGPCNVNLRVDSSSLILSSVAPLHFTPNLSLFTK